MHAYRRQQQLVAAFLAACVVIGLAGSLTARREIFPLYSWFLFSLVPTRTVAFDLLVRQAGERLYDPPVSYRQAGEVFRTPHSIITYRALQDLGHAVERGDEEGTIRLRRVLEARFTAWPLRYDLVKVSSDNPLEHWKTGRPQRSELLVAFRSDGPTAPPTVGPPP